MIEQFPETVYISIFKKKLCIRSQIVLISETFFSSCTFGWFVQGKGKLKNAYADQEDYNKRGMLQLLNSILQEEIELFWDPPVAEEVFVK